MTTPYDNIYTKVNSPSESAPARALESVSEFDPARHVSPGIAHELNNILAIVQGYADRLLLKYANDTKLTAELKSITEAARRAAVIIRDSTPKMLVQPPRPTPREEPEHSMA
jgi:hypothetical protein